MASSGNIRIAVRSLRRNKTRSLLTMLGIIIGVMSVVLVVGIGEGIKHEVNSQADQLGKDLITVLPGRLLMPSPSSLLSAGSALTGLSGSSGAVLSNDDLQLISRTPGVGAAVPLSTVQSDVVSDERPKPLTDLVVLGTSPRLPDVTHQSLAFGAFFTDGDTMADKVVLGSNAASSLFDERVPLGQSLRILGHQFIVVGIMNDVQAAPFAAGTDMNNAVFLPYASALAITNNDSPIFEVLARPADQSRAALVVQRLTSTLLTAHGGQHNITVMKLSDASVVTNNVLRLLAVSISGVAAVLLLVGGIGIMNIMLVSVTERMHEIGIRKAIGATDRQILLQFMTEATVLSLSGGFIGLLLSLLISGAVVLTTNITPMITWQVVIAALTVSVGVGILFGSVPALHAARRDPISALRNE